MLAERCVELLEAGAAGLVLADGRGALQLVAASTESASLAELFQIQKDEGPACTVTAAASRCSSATSPPGTPRHGGPGVAAGAREMGGAGVHAIPVRLRDDVTGGLPLTNFTFATAET